MPGRPAARLGDLTAHGSPLALGPCSINVFIGKKPACRVGDTIQEITNVNKIAIGEFTVLIGG